LGDEASKTHTRDLRFCFPTSISPNDDLDKRNRRSPLRSGVSFLGTLRVFVDQIEYSHPRNVHRNDTPTSCSVWDRRWPLLPFFGQSPFQTSCRQLTPVFDKRSQTCLFTIFPNISTTISASQFWGNREKAGLSKTRVSCRRLFQTRVCNSSHF